MKAEEAVRYLRYCQVNKETHDMRSQHAADLIEAQQEVVKAAMEMVKCQNGGYVEFHTYYGKALKACEKALAELEGLK